MLVLRTLQWGPQHGHGIGQAIRSQSDDLLKVETGSLYPALHRLEKRGWLKVGVGRSAKPTRGRSTTSLTAAGKAQLLPRTGSLVAARGRDRPHHEPGARQGVVAWCPTSATSTRRSVAIWRSARRQRIERGEDPEAARLAALREFGYVPAMRDSMRRVWYSRWLESVAALGRDLRIAVRSLAPREGARRHRRGDARARHRRQRRDLQRRPRRAVAPARQSRRATASIYIRQSAPALGAENMTFSIPEIRDLKSAHHHRQRASAISPRSTSRWLASATSPASSRPGVVNGSYLRRHGPPPGARPPAERRRRRARRGRRGGADLPLLDDGARRRSGRSSAGRSASARVPRRWSACSSPRCRIRPTPKSSPTS